MVKERPGRICVDYVEGPLKYLHNEWKFEPSDDGGTNLCFSVDFAFRSRIFEALAGLETSLPSELSLGMKQKVALACAFVHDPRALLLDEPLTGLDPLGIHRMKQVIVAYAGGGAAVLVSSHLLHLVEEICTRIVIINRGVKVADGTLAELAAQAKVPGSTLERIFLDVTGAGS